MKAVKISCVKKRGDLYEVCLLPEKTVCFKNKKRALAFLSMTNRRLTAVLHEINYLLIEIYSAYRMNWFYFFHDKKTMSEELTQADERCAKIISIIEQGMSEIVSQSKTDSKFYTAISTFNGIFDLMTEAILLLKQLNENKSHAETLYKFDSLSNRVNSLRKEMLQNVKECGNIKL